MGGIGRLAGGIAHDFNNVLTTILGLSESMISGRITPSSDSLKEIQQDATHAAELTRGLLAFSRRQILQMRSTHLSAAVESAVKMMSRLIGADILLDVRVQADLPPIRGDQSQIEQVLLNLCVNACDAMLNGGELHIGVSADTVGDEWCNLHPPFRARHGRGDG